MTDIEKESIEQLKSWREYIIKHKESVNKANDIEFYLRTALNLIQKQDTEINKLKNVIDRMALELYNYANLGLLGICPAEQENENYNLDLCKMNLAERNCLICIREYFMKEDK